MTPQPPDETTVPARPAASLLLTREDGRAASEVFTLRRAGSMAFSAHATAFPGGRVDPSDALDATMWSDVDLADWAHRLGLDAAAPEGALSELEALTPADAAGRLLAAVVRETYEETGVLLARDATSGRPVRPEVVHALPEDTRSRLEAHDLGFGELLASHGLRPDVEALVPWSRWITPPGGPRRYDTVFFIVRLPAGQEPARLSSEAADHGWHRPEKLLARFRAGEANLMTPTWWQLRHLQEALDDAEAGAAWAAIVRHGAVHAPVRAVMLSPRGEAADRRREFTHAAQYLADLAAFRSAARVAESPDNVL